MKAVIVLLVAMPFLGCAAASHISSEPPRALVYIDGALIGKTPVVYHHHPGPPRRYHIEIVRDGYEPVDVYLDTRMNYLWGILGAVLYVPRLWAWALDDVYVFRLQPRSGNQRDIDWRAEWEQDEVSQGGVKKRLSKGAENED